MLFDAKIFSFVLLITCFGARAQCDFPAKPLPVFPSEKHISSVIPTLGGPYATAYSLYKILSSTGFEIPKYFWVTSKNISAYPRQRLLKRHPKWTVNLVDDYHMDLFMEKVFAKTSTLMVYRAINPLLGACKADIWRYCVTYIFGGVYIDADAAIGKSLEGYLRPKDAFIFGTESNAVYNCYKPEYKRGRENNNAQNSSTLFENRFIIQWLFVSAPRHVFLKQVINLAVDVILHEQRGERVIVDFKKEDQWQQIICATGPGAFTIAIRQVIERAGSRKNAEQQQLYRFAGLDLIEIDGHFKEEDWKLVPTEYYVTRVRSGAKLLRCYDNSSNPSSVRQSNKGSLSKRPWSRLFNSFN